MGWKMTFLSIGPIHFKDNFRVDLKARALFFLPYRPTAAKTLVKNPPSQESTDSGLRMPIEAYLTVAQGVSFHMMFPQCMGQMSYNPATTNQNVTTLFDPTLKKYKNVLKGP